MKSLFRPFVLVLAVSSSWHIAMSQETKIDSVKLTPPQEKVHKDTRPIGERVSFGGSTGFWIKTSQTHLEVAGLVA